MDEDDDDLFLLQSFDKYVSKFIEETELSSNSTNAPTEKNLNMFKSTFGLWKRKAFALNIGRKVTLISFNIV